MDKAFSHFMQGKTFHVGKLDVYPTRDTTDTMTPKAEEKISLPYPESESNTTDAPQSAPEPAEEAEAQPLNLPNDAREWRSLLASLPTRDLFRIIQRDRMLTAHVFAGFRPSADMMKHPVVMGRLVEDAQRHKPLAEALAALTSGPVAEEKSAEEKPASESASAKVEAKLTPAMVSPAGDGTLKETIKKQKLTIRDQETKIQELNARITSLQKERDAARQETETARAAVRAAKEETERERRLREREARRGKEQETAPKTTPKTESAPVRVVTAIAAAPVPQPFTESLQRLINRGRYPIVAEVCHEALSTDAATNYAASRGRVLALLAASLYGMGDVQGGEEQDRLAANALLDGSEIVAAAETMARLFTQTAYFAPGSPVRQSDAATLRRMLLLAERDGLAPAVNEVFTRMRIASAEAGRRLRATMMVSGKKGTTLADAALGTSTDGSVVLGPDEPVALPTTHASASTVTARQLAMAVDAGEAGFIAQVRAGLVALRERSSQDARLADALLEAVTAVEPVAVTPLLARASNPVVVDASNVARHNPDPLALSAPHRVGHLLSMRDYLLRQGFFPIILIADATLRFHMDDRVTYQTLVDRHIIRETPPGTSADEALLKEARNRNAPLISNDRFAEWGDIVQQVDRRGFLISNGRVALVQ